MSENCKRILIRVDGNPKIGYGHISNAVTIVDYFNNATPNVNFTILTDNVEIFKQHKIKADFIKIRNTEDYGILATKRYISKNEIDCAIFDITDPYRSLKLETDLAKLIKWLRKREIVSVLVQGIATSVIYPDLIFNGTIVEEWHQYKFSNNTKYFIGPEYMLLSKHFHKFVDRQKLITNRPKQVLITFGGSAPQHILQKLIPIILRYDPCLNIKVIIGFPNRSFDKYNFMEDSNIEVLYNIQNIADSMFNSDFAVTSGGKTLYELAFLGIPTLAIPIVEHQVFTINAFARRGFIPKIGLNWTIDDLEQKIRIMLRMTVKEKNKLANIGRNIIDGRGVERVYKIIMNHIQ